MPDYQSNSKRSKDTSDIPKKNIERVVAEVIIPKKSIGRKIHDLFIASNFKTAAKYVALSVLLPAAKNMLFESVNKGSEQLIYGDASVRRRGPGQGSYTTYNSPVNRAFGGSPIHHAPVISPDPRVPRLGRTDFLLSTREEAETVLENMYDLISTYEIASVADLNELVGLPTTHVDNKWGWANLSGTQIRQIREGFLIDLPPAEPIQ